MRSAISTLVLAWGLGLLSLGGSDLAAQAVTPDAVSVVADTGVVTLGPNQVLRLTAVNGGGGPGTVSVRFREIGYAAGVCNGPVCTHAVVSSNPYGLVTLTGGAALSLELSNTAHGVRGVVSSDSQDLNVLVQILDAATGEVVAFSTPHAEGFGN